MGELLTALLSLLLAFLLHLAWWRARVPRRQTRALLAAFLGVLALVLAALPRLAAALPFLGFHGEPGLPALLLVAGLVVSVSLAYVVTYSAVEVDSPSLLMVLLIHRAGPSGLPVRELRERLDDRLLVEPRLRDLLRDGLAGLEGDVYRLTPKGESMARLFARHRRLLGAGKGG